ncbi:uncharacterized protein LOC130625602 [Hydractinia symbiolongicarpus]|uniref:uncharacterized protein LOC130625602 n=1 Tax=Hydractinia symbiolongicarpus TaxID=13093 RepID=UPI00254C4D9C|nr:uncharacterized protein LOC130625602 [Hydractinia symbiolongicarpus]
MVFFTIIFIGISFGSLVSAGLERDITRTCNGRPDFYQSTVRALAAVGTAVNKPMDNGRRAIYNKAHILPWTFIRTKVCGEFNEQVNERTKTERDLKNWKTIVQRFNVALHTIDTQWVDYGKMDRKEKAAYEKANGMNQEKCKQLINQVQLRRKSNTAIVAGVVAVAECMNSSPANLRPGFATTNREIADNLDPMLRRTVANGVAIRESDLTTMSKRLHQKYGLAYPTYRNRGIMSSDQTLQ